MARAAVKQEPLPLPPDPEPEHCAMCGSKFDKLGYERCIVCGMPLCSRCDIRGKKPEQPTCYPHSG